MNLSSTLHPAARVGFAALIDYAGLFPPAALRIDEAVQAYDAARRGPHGWMLGRFIAPADRIATLGGAAKEFALSAIGAPEALAEIAALRAGGARVEVIEIKLGPQNQAGEAIAEVGFLLERHGLLGIPVFVEPPRDDRWLQTLPAATAAAAERGLGLKLRCGGLQAAEFPSVEQVAAFVEAAVKRGVPFKATAGLHHPIRHYDARVGTRMHGFLNLLAAAALAGRVAPKALERVLSEEDSSAFRLEDTGLRWREERITLDELRSTRERRFVAYGSCSFDEPIDDLTALGMLAPA